MKGFLLRPYEDRQRQQAEAIFHKASASYPYTLAHSVDGIVRELSVGSYSKAMNYTLDFFETASQYISLVLFALLKHHCSGTGIQDGTLVKVIRKIDSKRPLSFGDWCNDILMPLAAAAAAALPDDPLVKSLSVVLRPKHNIFLGGKNAPSIVQIRNEYRGHSTTMSEEIYRGVVYTLEPRLLDLLEALSPLAEAWYYAAPTGGGATVSMKGNSPVPAAGAPQVQEGHYMICVPGGPLLDMFPLMFCDRNGYIYIFQSLINEDISYISTNESALRNVGDRLNEDFDAYMQQILPSFDISDTLNWNEWVDLLHEESAGFMRRVYNERKYNRELFVDRKQLSEEMDAFMGDGSIMFPLPGDAGQGKTNQLCHWTEMLMQEGEAVLIMSGAEFSSVRLEDKLRSVFRASPRKPVRKIVDALHSCARQKGRKVVVLIDAINECLTYSGSEIENNGAAELYSALYDIFCRDGYTCFKVLFTCRTYTWKNILYPVVAGQPASFFHLSREGGDSVVKGFTEDELCYAYSIYGELYQMATPYGELSKGSIIRLRDPLVLKIACTNYLGRSLPDKVRDYSSIDLFHRMLGDISVSYAGNRQKEILLGMAEYFLDSYERGIPADSLLFSELRNPGNGPLAVLSGLIMKDDGTTVAYGELLNKPERPVLRFVEDEKVSGEGKIQFIYERFLEYLLALVYYRREAARSGGGCIPPQRIVETLSSAHVNEVFMGVMRNVLIMDYVHTGRSDTLIGLVSHYGGDFNVTAVVNDAISILVNENYEDELFSLCGTLLNASPDCTESIFSEYNALGKAIQGNRATEEVIAAYRRLSEVLTPVLRLRQLASVTLMNGIFLTDYYNESVYTNDPFGLLWRLLEDPLTEVRDGACMHIYYVSNKTRTLNYTPLKENISRQIIGKMHEEINASSLSGMVISRQKRSRIVTFLEIATRLNVLLIIDALLSGDASRRESVGEMLAGTTGIFRHLTYNFRLVKVLMPFFSMVLRRQITFQSSYVNNIIEYQSFWDDSVIPPAADDVQWSRRDLKEIMGTIFSYSRYYSKGKPVPDFSRFVPKVLSAYRTGDSFSYFALERLLIVNGTCDINVILPIAEAFSSQEYTDSQWYDYSQMSMIYVLYQLGMKSEEFPEKLWEILGLWCAGWTRRCRGYFRARNSHKANPMQMYKRNVMTWYAMVFSSRNPGSSPEEIRRGIPLFFRLIDEAVDSRDKELLVHLIENISELVSDSGYVTTSLELLKYLLEKIDSREMLAEFDMNANLRYPSTSEDIISLVGGLLATAKNYFPHEVDDFLKKDLVGLNFPGIGQYREDILNYNPGGETLSDLFTHRFGNFLIWSLVNEEAVDEFAYEAMCASADASDCFSWFDNVVRILFRHLFRVRI